jgi:O-antigen ligase
MISTATRPRNDRFLRIAIALTGVLYLLLVVRALVGVQDDFGNTSWLVLVPCAALPLAIFTAFRAPLIFPFGAYLFLLPYDSLLTVSSGATVTRLVAIATGGALLLRVLLLRTARQPPRAWFAWFAFMLFVAISFLWTADLPTGQLIFQQSFQLFLMLTILALYPATEFEFKGVLVILVLSGICAALYGVHLYQAGSVSMYEDRLVLATSSGVALDPNYFATSFILPIAVAFAGTFYTRNIFLRLLCAASSLVMMCGVLVSGSRGAFVAIGVMFVYFVIRSKNRLQVGGVVAAAIGLSAFFPSVWTRFIKDPSAAGSGSGRTYIWQTGLHSFSQHWLLGGGVGSFQTLYDASLLSNFQPVFQGWSRPSHSIVVGTLTEYGIVGLIRVLGAWYLTFRQTSTIPVTSRFYGVRLASEAALIGLFSQAFFIDTLLIKYYWLAYAVPLIIFNLACRPQTGARAARDAAVRHAR